MYCNYKWQFLHVERLQSTNKLVVNTVLPAVARTVLSESDGISEGTSV